MRKMILVLVGSTTLLAATSANAEPYNGLYAGLNAGYVAMTFRADLGNGVIPLETENALFSGVLGYRKNIANTGFVLGLEGEINYIDYELGDTDVSVGFSGIAGYSFGRPMLYGRVGYTELNVFNISRDGVSYGGGLEYAFGEHFSLRTEYRYTDWENIGPGNPNAHTYLISALWNF